MEPGVRVTRDVPSLEARKLLHIMRERIVEPPVRPERRALTHEVAHVAPRLFDVQMNAG